MVTSRRKIQNTNSEGHGDSACIWVKSCGFSLKSCFRNFLLITLPSSSWVKNPSAKVCCLTCYISCPLELTWQPWSMSHSWAIIVPEVQRRQTLDLRLYFSLQEHAPFSPCSLSLLSLGNLGFQVGPTDLSLPYLPHLLYLHCHPGTSCFHLDDHKDFGQVSYCPFFL